MTITTTRLHLIRHGQVEGFEQPRYNGQAEVPLTEQGIQQYHSLRGRLAGVPIAACYTSDLSRCMVGAEIICRQWGLQPLVRPGLRELNIGIWEGLTWAEINERWPEEWQARLADFVHYRAPEGENVLDVEARVMPVIHEILQKHQGEDVLVVGHGGVNRIILLNALGAPLSALFGIEQNFGCYNIIDYYSDARATIKLMNG